MNEIKILIQLTHPAAVVALLDAAENYPEDLESATGELLAALSLDDTFNEYTTDELTAAINELAADI